MAEARTKTGARIGERSAAWGGIVVVAAFSVGVRDSLLPVAAHIDPLTGRVLGLTGGFSRVLHGFGRHPTRPGARPAYSLSIFVITRNLS